MIWQKINDNGKRKNALESYYNWRGCEDFKYKGVI